MLVNPDFSLRAVVTPDQHRWVASPQSGVERVLLDRLGGEQARATSLVRYAKSSSFPEHAHAQGEEILVLDGTFSECGHDYPAGWYLRNPPGSSHCPSSENGATLFVKLRQMSHEEREVVRIDTRDPSRWLAREGRDVCPLFRDETETVWLERVAPNGRIDRSLDDTFLEGGAEFLLLEGTLHDRDSQSHCDDVYLEGSWIRTPPSHRPTFIAGDEGATVYIKTGHLGAVAAQETRR
nr:hypothetical protein HUO10_006380 [Paraburkholderia busanensis]